jgi:hypothetical protein
VSDLAPLASLMSLRSLDIFSTNVSDLRPLAIMGSLRWLTLCGCSSVSDVTPLWFLVNLQRLEIHSCRDPNCACVAAMNLKRDIPTIWG